MLDWEGQLQCELGSCYDSWEIFRSDKLARVRRDGLYGFINLAGEEIVPCQYEAATTYHDWVVLAGSQEEGFTAFDKSGEVLGTLDGSVNYDDTSEKLIQYMDESTGLYGYLNPDGSVAVEAAYTSVYPFSGGYAPSGTKAACMALSIPRGSWSSPASSPMWPIVSAPIRATP